MWENFTVDRETLTLYNDSSIFVFVLSRSASGGMLLQNKKTFGYNDCITASEQLVTHIRLNPDKEVANSLYHSGIFSLAPSKYHSATTL